MAQMAQKLKKTFKKKKKIYIYRWHRDGTEMAQIWHSLKRVIV
jgi:hypothetical protein